VLPNQLSPQSSLPTSPKPHNKYQLYEIQKENERLVEKLSFSKGTVASHKVSKRKFYKAKMKDQLRAEAILKENQRLYHRIRWVSSDLSYPHKQRKPSPLFCTDSHIYLKC
jgi:hypothetical protein